MARCYNNKNNHGLKNRKSKDKYINIIKAMK